MVVDMSVVKVVPQADKILIDFPLENFGDSLSQRWPKQWKGENEFLIHSANSKQFFPRKKQLEPRLLTRLNMVSGRRIYCQT